MTRPVLLLKAWGVLHFLDGTLLSLIAAFVLEPGWCRYEAPFEAEQYLSLDFSLD